MKGWKKGIEIVNRKRKRERERGGGGDRKNELNWIKEEDLSIFIKVKQ